MKNVVIAGYVRSPFTPANKGELAKVRPDELAAQVIKGLVQKTGLRSVPDLLRDFSRCDRIRPSTRYAYE